MITILNGKLTIPESERFIGFAGDNLARKIEYIISGQKQEDRIYRLYLTFDDGTVNYFVLPSQVTEEGVLLTWEVQRKHIYKSGNVRAQIKAFSGDGVVYHTTSDTFIVGSSAEFSDEVGNINSEFLEYEEKLNNIAQTISDVCVLMPYIGENGNWYIYDSETGEYKDSGKPSVMKIENYDIADGSINREELFSDEMKKAYLSLPVKAVTFTGALKENYYNSFTEPGVYQIDSLTGVHKVLIALSPDSDSHLMQILLSYDQIRYRGIWCTTEGIYADEDWEDWIDLTQDRGFVFAGTFNSLDDICSYNFKSEKLYAFWTASGLQSLVGNGPCVGFSSYKYVDEQKTDTLILFNCQTGTGWELDLTTKVFTRKTPDSNLIEDAGEYFVADTVEGALQELGAELYGVSDLLSQI